MTLPIVCTDRGQHGRVTIAELDRASDGQLTHRSSYTKRAPWVRGAESDGTAVTDRVVMPAENPRDDYEGLERWRFKCKRCRRDVILPPDKLHAAFDAPRVMAIDISLIP
jgi:hypothetical protein